MMPTASTAQAHAHAHAQTRSHAHAHGCLECAGLLGHTQRLWAAPLYPLSSTDVRRASARAQILGNNECFEPYTSNLYVRRTLAGEFFVPNPGHMRHGPGPEGWGQRCLAPHCLSVRPEALLCASQA